MKLDRITSHPSCMNGQPCIRNLRLTVRRVIELLAIYPDRQELFQEFPEKVVSECEEDLNQGAAITVEPTRIRIRRLPFLPDS